ncbi:hypothetical protein AAVH_15439 [Aphelenchoides avenae]|nr:hypothetical protein AAVH_15439 [Aphelenchus avenae]
MWRFVSARLLAQIGIYGGIPIEAEFANQQAMDHFLESTAQQIIRGKKGPPKLSRKFELTADRKALLTRFDERYWDSPGNNGLCPCRFKEECKVSPPDDRNVLRSSVDWYEQAYKHYLPPEVRRLTLNDIRGWRDERDFPAAELTGPPEPIDDPRDAGPSSKITDTSRLNGSNENFDVRRVMYGVNRRQSLSWWSLFRKFLSLLHLLHRQRLLLCPWKRCVRHTFITMLRFGRELLGCGIVQWYVD